LNDLTKNFRISIKKEYSEAVPPLSTEEYKSLTESIVHRGLLVPLVVNVQGIVLDGHHRLDICNNLGKTPTYVIKEFDNKDEEFQYVVETNVNRRQMNSFQKVECFDRLIKIYQKKAKKNMGRGGFGRKEKVPYAQGNTALHFSNTIGVPEKTISTILYIKKNGDPLMFEHLRNNIITINQAYLRLTEEKPIHVSSRERLFECPHCHYELHKKDLIRVG